MQSNATTATSSLPRPASRSSSRVINILTSTPQPPESPPLCLISNQEVPLGRFECNSPCCCQWGPPGNPNLRILSVVILPLPAGDLELAGGFHVPDVIAEMSAAQVLTTEWVPGVAINKVSELSQEVMIRHPSISYLLRRGTKVSQKQCSYVAAPMF